MAGFCRDCRCDVADAGARAQQVAHLTARDLRDIGINTNCAPVLDIPVTGSHDIIGSRAYAHEVEAIVATIARAADRHFILRQRLDVPFELGAMAHACGALRLAESLYLSAIAESGEAPASLYNLALIMRSTDRAEYGQALIARVLELDPEHDRARKLLGGT